MLLLLMLTVLPAPSVSPLTTRSMPVAVAKSRLPLSVTPSRKLAPLLVATSLPLPVVLIVPPVIAMPF